MKTNLPVFPLTPNESFQAWMIVEGLTVSTAAKRLTVPPHRVRGWLAELPGVPESCLIEDADVSDRVAARIVMRRRGMTNRHLAEKVLADKAPSYAEQLVSKFLRGYAPMPENVIDYLASVSSAAEPSGGDALDFNDEFLEGEPEPEGIYLSRPPDDDAGGFAPVRTERVLAPPGAEPQDGWEPVMEMGGTLRWIIPPGSPLPSDVDAPEPPVGIYEEWAADAYAVAAERAGDYDVAIDANGGISMAQEFSLDEEGGLLSAEDGMTPDFALHDAELLFDEDAAWRLTDGDMAEAMMLIPDESLVSGDDPLDVSWSDTAAH